MTGTKKTAPNRRRPWTDEEWEAWLAKQPDVDDRSPASAEALQRTLDEIARAELRRRLNDLESLEVSSPPAGRPDTHHAVVEHSTDE